VRGASLASPGLGTGGVHGAGTTLDGGAYGDGTVFEIDSDATFATPEPSSLVMTAVLSAMGGVGVVLRRRLDERRRGRSDIGRAACAGREAPVEVAFALTSKYSRLTHAPAAISGDGMMKRTTLLRRRGWGAAHPIFAPSNGDRAMADAIGGGEIAPPAGPAGRIEYGNRRRAGEQRPCPAPPDATARDIAGGVMTRTTVTPVTTPRRATCSRVFRTVAR
jgi:hypothetical protein